MLAPPGIIARGATTRRIVLAGRRDTLLLNISCYTNESLPDVTLYLDLFFFFTRVHSPRGIFRIVFFYAKTL